MDIEEFDWSDEKGNQFSGYFVPDINQLYEKVGWADSLKDFSSFDEAASWWSEIGGGADYFVVAASTNRRGKTTYHVVEIRTQHEKDQHGELSGMTRARRILDRQSGLGE
jgi:hypothetical protein